MGRAYNIGKPLEKWDVPMI